MCIRDSTPTRANIVCLNSALILYVAGKADSIQEGYMRSHELIASGKAYKALELSLIHIF